MGSRTYFRNIFGQVFIGNSTGCLDICLIPSYKRVKDVDIKTFKALSYNNIPTSYAKDSNHVYINGEVLIGADSATFSLAHNNVGFDRSDYFIGKTKLSDYLKTVNPADYENSNTKVVAVTPNGSILFTNNSDMNILSQNPFKLQKLRAIDSKTFAPAFGSDGQLKQQIIKFDEDLYTQESPKYIGFDKNFEYIELMSGSVDMVNTRDSSVLFLKYGAGYTKIGNQIFFLTNPIKNIDLASFNYIGKDFKDTLNRRSYAKDKNHVYFDGTIIEGADLKSFTIIKGRGSYGYTFSFDNSNKYFLGQKINPNDKQRNERYNEAYQNRIALIK